MSLSPSQRATADARLHLRVVHEGRGVAILEDVIGGAEAFLDIAAALRHRLRFILRVRARDCLRARSSRASGFERFFRIEHEGQNFVVDGDEPQRFFGDVAIDGGDGGDRLARQSAPDC